MKLSELKNLCEAAQKCGDRGVLYANPQYSHEMLRELPRLVSLLERALPILKEISRYNSSEDETYDLTDLLDLCPDTDADAVQNLLKDIEGE